MAVFINGSTHQVVKTRLKFIIRFGTSSAAVCNIAMSALQILLSKIFCLVDRILYQLREKNKSYFY
jgi:hypothetical protein